jgi:3-hydroxyacyl-CoA dehydrogenase
LIILTEGFLDKALKKGKIAEADVHRVLGQISTSTDTHAIHQCDFVVEVGSLNQSKSWQAILVQFNLKHFV